MAVYFGELTNRVEHRAFDGASLTAVAASCRMDLRQATVDAGGERFVDVFCLFAGMTIVVPQHWEVTLDVMSALSEVRDKRAAPVTPAAPGSAPRLYVRGTVVMSEFTIDD
jgi:hypothetical protein